MEKLDKLILLLQESETIDGLDSDRVNIDITSDDWYFDKTADDKQDGDEQSVEVIQSKLSSKRVVPQRILIDFLAIGCSFLAFSHYNDPDLLTRVHSRFMMAVSLTRLLEAILIPESRWFVSPASNPRTTEYQGLGLPTVVVLMTILIASNTALTLAALIFWLLTDGQNVVKITLSKMLSKLWA